MSHRNSTSQKCPVPLLSLLTAVLALLSTAYPAPAAEEKPAALGKITSPAGTLLRRMGQGKAWQALPAQAGVAANDILLALPGSRGSIDATSGPVRLTLWGNIPELALLPVLESVVSLHENPKADLEFTLERGRVLLTNARDREAATVRVRIRGQVWDMSLATPGGQVALELYGRWPRGALFSKTPKIDDQPTTAVVLLVLKGDVSLKAGGQEHFLRAPPGPAYFQWDSVAGFDPGPKAVRYVPAWARPEAAEKPQARTVQAILDTVSKGLMKESPDAVLTGLLKGADADPDDNRASLKRELVVYSFGAVDDLPRLLDALGDPKHPDARETAVEALRAWIGRGPGSDMKLYTFLVEQRRFSAGQAEIVMQLLHNPFDPDEPETYETLINYLRAKQPAIGELARRHLYRLAPAGKDIPYNPAGTAEERDQAFKAWKKLVPDGQLPPKPKKEGK